MLLNNIPIIVGGLLETVAVHPFILIIGRFGVGLNNGLLRIVTSNTVSPYLIYTYILTHYIPHKTSNVTMVYMYINPISTGIGTISYNIQKHAYS